jgi:hypothetical protein
MTKIVARGTPTSFVSRSEMDAGDAKSTYMEYEVTVMSEDITNRASKT